MSEYCKIQTVFLRDPETKYKTLLDGQWALPEFEYLAGCQWLFTEKVDGTNTRIMWDGVTVRFGGKTDNAQIPVPLLDVLQDLFPVEKVSQVLAGPLVLYGEGFGGKIQGGGGYGDTQFVLFDARAGFIWLERDTLISIAAAFSLLAVPVLGYGTLNTAIAVTKNREIPSCLRKGQAEGLVMRPVVNLNTRLGRRVIAKIKVKDFVVTEEPNND